MKITGEIIQIGGSGLTAPEDAAVYLINFDGHAAMIDAGCGASVGMLLKNIRASGLKLNQIACLLLTHCHFDHAGGAKAIQDKTGCRIVAHERDAQFLEEGNNAVTAAAWYGSVMKPFQIDWKLSGEVTDIELGNRIIKAIHIPGHSPGSLAYLTESEGKTVLFAQDVHGPLAPTLLSDEEAYLDSLQKLLELEADILCEGHYGIFKGKEEVKGFIASFLEGE